MRNIAILIVSALIILSIPYILPGFFVNSFLTALLVAVVLGLINITLRPLLIILTLPLTLVTFGLFIFLINALLLWFTSYLIPGFEIAGFLPAFIGALLITVGRWIVEKAILKEE